MSGMDKIPQLLRGWPQWVTWGRTADGGLDKVPRSVQGCNASSTDPATWATFEQAAEVVRSGRSEGVGFVFGGERNFVGVDLDGCRNKETGKIEEWARGIITDLDSYSEISPSGTGVKVYCLGRSPFDTGRNQKLEQFPAVDPIKKPGIEVYDHARFFAMTGNRLGGKLPKEPQERTAQVASVCGRFFKQDAPAASVGGSAGYAWRSEEAVIERAREYLKRIPPAIEGQGGDKATFRAACVLVLGFALQLDAAYGLLAEWNLACQPPWDERRLRRKVDEANKQGGERGYLRNAPNHTWDAIQVPEYAAPTQQAKASTKGGVPERVVEITTLKEATAAALEKATSGVDELITLGVAELDYAIGGGAERGEVVVLAARPSHCKSAVAMQCVHHWTDRGRKTLIVSEEMSRLALGKRALQFITDVPQEHWFQKTKTVKGDVDAHFAGRAEAYIAEGCRSADRVADEIRKHAKEHAVECVVVDYAQLLSAPGKSRYEIVTNTIQILRAAVNDTRVVLLLLAQLNRDIEGRDQFKPQMSDLKESGQIEQDADVIVFGVWPFKLDGNKSPNEYQFFVCKNRNRPVVKPAFTAHFEPSRQKISHDRSNRVEAFDTFNSGGIVGDAYEEEGEF